MGGSYSNQRSVSAVANDRMILDQIREEGPTFRGRFLGRWGDEIEAEWRNRGRFYVDPRRAVSYPELEDDALVFSICSIGAPEFSVYGYSASMNPIVVSGDYCNNN